MNNLRLFFIACCPLLILIACSSESTTPRGFGSGTEPPPDGADPSQDTPDSTSSNPADAGTKGKEADAKAHDAAIPKLPTNDAGCLTYAAAQQVCGFSSDGTVCSFAAGCGPATDEGQCKINCEMQSTVTCFSQSDAQCLIDAVAAKSCAAIKACKWKL